MSDIEIARKAKTKSISEIAEKLHIPETALIPFGRTKAKIDPKYIESLFDKPYGFYIWIYYKCNWGRIHARYIIKR